MNSITIKLDFRLVSFFLLIVIIAMAAVWQPWQTTTKRTITVQGDSTVKAAPDEFTFSPIYEKTSKDSASAIAAVSEVGNNIVGKLKELGVTDSSIKTNVSTQKNYKPNTSESIDEVSAQFSITATVNDKDKAQKIVNYLSTTGPLYGVSPQSTFKKETQTSLETRARGKALANARTKADQTAKELNVKVGAVVSVSEPSWGGPIRFDTKGVEPSQATDTSASPILLVGEQEVTYTVSVVFQIN